jgi:hypothetical protein
MDEDEALYEEELTIAAILEGRGGFFYIINH